MVTSDKGTEEPADHKRSGHTKEGWTRILMIQPLSSSSFTQRSHVGRFLILRPWSVMSGPLSSLPSLSIINSGHRMGSEWKERTRPDHGWWWQAKEGPAPRRSRLIPPHVILASFAAQRAEPFGRGEECNVGERRQTETKGEGPVAARKGEQRSKVRRSEPRLLLM